jgi:hypothetical protein
MKILIITISLFTLILFSCKKDDGSNPTQSNTPAGEYLSRTECKGSSVIEKDKIQSKIQDCVELEYIDNSLIIHHINTAMNCCPDALNLISIEIKNNMIIIDETKALGLCDCNCLFDFNYKINMLPKGIYKVTFIENMFNSEAGDLPCECTIDLNNSSKANACFDRSGYLYEN